MTKFTVLELFRWGDLNLEKGQTILIEDLGPNEIGNKSSMVSIQYYPNKKQLVSTEAVYSMEQLQKIKRL